MRDAVRRRRWTTARAEAVRGEDLAMRFLERHRYLIVARNYRPRAGYGEVDLIGWSKGRLAFIEVKTRSSEDTGVAERAVDRSKREHLERTAREYARRVNVEYDQVRFDVVTVVGSNLELFEGAFVPTRY